MTHWFDDALCGLFFHWGPYAVSGRGEWVMNRERIPPDLYREQFIDPWKAEAYDPDAWMAAAKTLGASYVVLTARHHDGFALWDSKVNDNNALRLGPKKDLVAGFVEAARRHGLGVGLYYSIANWVHPDYPGAFYRDWPEDEDWADDAARERFQAYNLAELTELMTNYGKIDYLWYDGGQPHSIRNPALNRMARENQLGILINNRNSPDGEVTIMEQGFRKDVPEGRWEACFTLNRNWGYHETDVAYKRPDELISMLCHTAENQGKLLLNIGPDAAGRIPPESMEVVTHCGRWIQGHREILTRASLSPFTWQNSGRVTVSGSSVFLHLFAWPKHDFCWAEVDEPLCAAILWPKKIPLAFEQQGARILLQTTEHPAPADGCCNIELQFENAPKPAIVSTSFWIPDE